MLDKIPYNSYYSIWLDYETYTRYSTYIENDKYYNKQRNFIPNKVKRYIYIENKSKYKNLNDTDYIGYANPVGSSYDIFINPTSGKHFLYKVEFINSIEYCYFQQYHIDLKLNFDKNKLGYKDLGKIKHLFTYKLKSEYNEKQIILDLDFSSVNIKLNDNKIIEKAFIKYK